MTANSIGLYKTVSAWQNFAYKQHDFTCSKAIVDAAPENSLLLGEKQCFILRDVASKQQYENYWDYPFALKEHRCLCWLQTMG